MSVTPPADPAETFNAQAHIEYWQQRRDSLTGQQRAIASAFLDALVLEETGDPHAGQASARYGERLQFQQIWLANLRRAEDPETKAVCEAYVAAYTSGDDQLLNKAREMLEENRARTATQTANNSTRSTIRPPR